MKILPHIVLICALAGNGSASLAPVSEPGWSLNDYSVIASDYEAYQPDAAAPDAPVTLSISGTPQPIVPTNNTPAQAPEPATLAIAGVGLIIISKIRAVRR